MNVKDKYILYSQRMKVRYDEKKREDEKVESQQTLEISEVLKSKKINPWTNGYLWKLRYGGLDVHFVNQITRICGGMHIPLNDEIEENMIRYLWIVEHEDPRLFSEIVEKYRVGEFVLYGNPASEITKVIDMIDNNHIPLIKCRFGE